MGKEKTTAVNRSPFGGEFYPMERETAEQEDSNEKLGVAEKDLQRNLYVEVSISNYETAFLMSHRR